MSIALFFMPFLHSYVLLGIAIFMFGFGAGCGFGPGETFGAVPAVFRYMAPYVALEPLWMVQYMWPCCQLRTEAYSYLV